MDRSYDLTSWKVFVTIAKTGSISAACRAFRTDAANLSRILQQLEKSVGVGALLDRSVRPMALTENGRTALAFAEKMLQLREDMDAELNHAPEAFKGILRVGLPPMVLRDQVTPELMHFTEQYPEIDLRVDEYTSGIPVDFSNGRGSLFDVVVSYGPSPSNQNIVQINYGGGISIACASPTYLKRHGVPTTPADLCHHTGIIVTTNYRQACETLRSEGKSVGITWKKQIVFNSASAAKTAALIGAGIHLNLPTLHCYRDIECGNLVPLLTDWEQPQLGLYIYSRPECIKLARVRLFIHWYRKVMFRLHQHCAQVLDPYLTDRVKELIRPKEVPDISFV